MAFHLRRQQLNLATSELTPIISPRVKRPHSHTSSAASSRASTPQVSSPKTSSITGTSKPSSKRQRLSSHKPSSIAGASKPPSKRQRRTRTLSSLELLPAELLSNIFSYTCNINFPRASPILASKLSGEHIYNQFCKRLFCSFELPALAPLFKRKSGVHRYRCYVGSLDEEKDLIRYREMAFTCKWMTLERFKRYREEIIEEEKACQQAIFSPGSSKKARKEAKNIELWLGENFILPTALLRYPSMPDPKHRTRGLALLNFLAVKYPLKIDPYTDGDERCRRFFGQAILAKDYHTVFSLVYGNLIDTDWVPELATTIAQTPIHDIRSLFVFWCFMASSLADMMESTSEAENGARLVFLKYIREQIEYSCPEENLENFELDLSWDAPMNSNPDAEANGWDYVREWFGDHDSTGGPWDEFHDLVHMDVGDHLRNMISKMEVSEEDQNSEHGSYEEASTSESEGNDEGPTSEAQTEEEEPVSDWRSDEE